MIKITNLCPKCEKKTLVISIFGTICSNCFYEPKQKNNMKKTVSKELSNAGKVLNKLRNESLTTDQKRILAKKAIKARWDKYKKNKKK